MKKYIIRFLLLFALIIGQSNAGDQEIEKSTIACTGESGSAADEGDDSFDEEFASCDQHIYDPLEGYNRWMTNFNDKVYLYALDPVARGYSAVVPQPVRIGLSNVINNLKFPLYFSNNLLQLKVDGSARELARFMINSTIGLLGLIDIAKEVGIKPAREDFGQTLGYWGVGSGFHLVLPFLGPSNLRDTLALGADWAASPLSYTGGSYQIPDNALEAAGIKAGEMVNATSLHLGEYQSLKKDALDWYGFLKNTYEEKRKKEIDE
jgi:phospholipid-binding lipoprotein MlaA